VENVWNGVFRYDDLRRENEQLRAQVDDLRGQQFFVTGKETQMQEAYDLLDLTWAPGIPSVPARIIGARPSNFDQTIQIDRGSDDGIKFGYPVVTGAGLLGRVVSVSKHSASVRLISDIAFTAGVSIGADATALVHGEGSGQLLSVELAGKPSSSSDNSATSTTSAVPTSDSAAPAVSSTSVAGATGDTTATTTPTVSRTVSVGDVVLTSGQDISLFPADIPVGSIASITSPPESGNLLIRVAPYVDLSRISLVKVLRWDAPSQARP
jgi:cell shape-determining protein MreC